MHKRKERQIALAAVAAFCLIAYVAEKDASGREGNTQADLAAPETEFAAGAEANMEAGGAVEAYDLVSASEARRIATAQLVLEGYDGSYGCTDDCTGHQAGWQWRATNPFAVGEPSTYGTSQSFAEGAMAFESALDERVLQLRSGMRTGGGKAY